jgi:hypothetical protein
MAGHPLEALEQVPEWIDDAMSEMGYSLVPCSWANAMYEWHDAETGTPPHTVEMFFFNGGKQVRLLATVIGDTYENAFCSDQDSDLLHSQIAMLRQRLRE